MPATKSQLELMSFRSDVKSYSLDYAVSMNNLTALREDNKNNPDSTVKEFLELVDQLKAISSKIRSNYDYVMKKYNVI